MKSSKDIMRLIKSFESFIPKIYKCPGGYDTIGFGHKVTQGSTIKEINIAEAEALLLKDIEQVESAVKRNISVTLSQAQFDALVSFTFNVGPASLQRSTLRQKINRCEHNLVPTELSRWVYSAGKILPGLIRRRSLEAQIYAS